MQDIPAGSRIEVRSELEGTVIVLPLPSGGRVGQMGGAAFLFFWLCGWAVGEVAAIMVLIKGFTGSGAPKGLGGFGMVFMLAWLGGWTIGGVAAMHALSQMLRKPKPERITLGIQSIQYDPGHLSMVHPDHSVSPSARASLFQWGGKRQLIDLRRAEIAAFVIDRVGERQRLYFEHGADRVEIGASLSEPEREWLFNELQQWRK